MKHFIDIVIIIVVAETIFTSCRTRYIPIEKIRTEYKVRDSIRQDSIYQHDSVFVSVIGDTVYQYKYKYLYKYQFINKTDTFIKTDSIQVPYPVEKALTRWQSLKLELGGFALFFIVGFVACWLIYKSIKK